MAQAAQSAQRTSRRSRGEFEEALAREGELAVALGVSEIAQEIGISRESGGPTAGHACVAPTKTPPRRFRGAKTWDSRASPRFRSIGGEHFAVCRARNPGGHVSPRIGSINAARLRCWCCHPRRTGLAARRPGRTARRPQAACRCCPAVWSRPEFRRAA